MPIGVENIDQNPVFADLTRLYSPEVQRPHGDLRARGRDPHPAVVGNRLDHVGPTGHGAVVVVAEKMVSDPINKS